MPRYDAHDAECTIRTFKEGLLSPLAHDLEIKVERFTLEVDLEPPRVEARFDARSLRTQGALAQGALRPGTLSSSDLRTVDGNIERAVLHADRHPEIRFVSEEVTPVGEGYALRGRLTLHGVTDTLTVEARAEGGRLVCEVVLDQTRFGIRPYSGLMGTMRIKPEVVVRVSVPRP